MTALMQHASPRMSSWASQTRELPRMKLKDADAQHTIIFIKSIRQAYLSSADAACAPIAVFDLEMSW